MPLQNLPGFRDFYPEDLAVRNHIFSVWRQTALRYGFREYDGPPLEPLELYQKKSGEELTGQLYQFVDKGERAVALRPEMTPTLARMVGAKEREFKKPIKWFSIPQLFRYERQQRGRLREHFQFNADIIGEENVDADAELIALAIESLRGFGLTENDFIVRISSRQAWRQKLLSLGIAEESTHYSVIQIIDKLEREPLPKTRAKLTELSLSESVIADVMTYAQETNPQTSEAADLAQLQDLLGTDLWKYCRVDLRIVRGLAYYTGIVWEIHDRNGEFRAIAGGGRYDNLISLVTDAKLNLAALGFGMGDVVLTELLKARGKLSTSTSKLDCYVVMIGDESHRAKVTPYIHEWRHQKLSVDYALDRGARVNKQFQAAAASGARFAVIIGPDELGKGECKLKDLATGNELPHPVKLTDLATVVRSLKA
jgi:histidyl-tRNA synthetase